MMDKHTGWFLLDVDGPLNPYRCKPHAPPDGYVSRRWLPSGEWLSSKEAKNRHTTRTLRDSLLVRLHPEHGKKLLAVAAETGLRLAWATTWMHHANAHVAPVIGLPELPVIDFGSDLVIDGDARSFVDGSAWKYRAVADFVAGLPVAWLDDEFTEHPSPHKAFLAQRGRAPTLLHQVSPVTGITEADLAAVSDWAKSLP